MTLARDVSPQTAFPTALRGYDRAAVDTRLAQLSAERLSFDQHAMALEQQLAALTQPRTGPPTHPDVGRTVLTILQAAHDDLIQLGQRTDAELRERREQAEAVAEAVRRDAIAAGERAEAAARRERERIIAKARERAREILAEADGAVAHLDLRARSLVDAAAREAARAAVDAGHKSAAELAAQQGRLEAEQRLCQELIEAAGRHALEQHEAIRGIVAATEHETTRLRESALATAESLLNRAEARRQEIRDQTDTAVSELAAEVRGLIDQLTELHRALTDRAVETLRLESTH